MEESHFSGFWVLKQLSATGKNYPLNRKGAKVKAEKHTTQLGGTKKAIREQSNHGT